jgi:hypothetical protein
VTTQFRHPYILWNASAVTPVPEPDKAPAAPKEMTMKHLILLAAIGAMAATPALARSHHNTVHHHHARNHFSGAYGYYTGATSPCVYVNGRYAGCDPDPNVRRSLVDEYYYLHRPFY